MQLKGFCASELSGVVLCDAAAIRIRIRIVRFQQPAKRQKHRPCETHARFLPPLLLVGSSGKEKAKKQKQIFLVIARLGGGSPDRVARGLPTGCQGSKVYVLCAEPKEHKHFRPRTRLGGLGYPAGRIGDRRDREIVFVPNVYVPFPAPSSQELVLKVPKGGQFHAAIRVTI